MALFAAVRLNSLRKSIFATEDGTSRAKSPDVFSTTYGTAEAVLLQSEKNFFNRL
jgi:hypothetical protein